MKSSQRILLILGGLLCIGAFFLPYFSINYGLGKWNASGLYYSQTLYEYFQAPTGNANLLTKAEDKAFDIIYDAAKNAWEKKSTLQFQGLSIVAVIVALGPFYFFLFGLGYVYRGLFGKVYKRGIIFNLLFLGLSWTVFHFLSQEVPLIDISFFGIASFGYWIAFAGMFVAAISDFFGKKEA